MEALQIVKLSPTENMTVLVETPVARALHAGVAEELMRYDSACCEQVGFVEKPANSAARARLQMMGGEFCGNAAMSLAALLAWREGIATGEERSLLLEVSGAEGLVACRVRAQENGFEGTVEMPLPLAVEEVCLPFEQERFALTAVRFEGIVHLLLPRPQGLSRERAQRMLRAFAGAFPQEAVGLLLLEEGSDAMEPLVYVKPTDSLVWERGCASGSAAVGAARAARGAHEVCMRQPGGEITVRMQAAQGRLTKLSITGLVRIVFCGQAYV